MVTFSSLTNGETFSSIRTKINNNFAALINALTSTSAVIDKASGQGIKVDTTTPTFPFQDIIGTFIPDPSGPNAPTLTALIGGSCRSYAYGAGKQADYVFHIPHDYVPGTDIFVHMHWAHNGTAISGNFSPTIKATYAKGHNQANFSTEITLAATTVSTPDIATVPRYRHRLDEFQLSQNGGSANLLDSSLLEPDGIVLLSFYATTIPTITGGSPNSPFVQTVDLHYQSTNIGTKSKSPNFYA